MPDLITKPIVELDRDTEYEQQTGEPTCAHIVRVEPGGDAAATVLEARIYGSPIEALCGHRWIPSRDPKQLPICEKCKEIYEMHRMFDENLNETPSD